MTRIASFFIHVLIVFIAMMQPVNAQKLPGEAEKLMPMLLTEIDHYWVDLTPQEYLFGLIEQESLWKPSATLKTSREWGCGLGQFTKAYDANGHVRFDALEETRRLDSSLKDWDWRDCTATQYQLRAVVLKSKVNERSCVAYMKTNLDIKACAAAINNGGAGSFTKRIRSCRMQTGCDPSIWFMNLEAQCPQAQVKVAGYGESFCDINSKYPGRVFMRMEKYKPYIIKLRQLEQK